MGDERKMRPTAHRRFVASGDTVEISAPKEPPKR
jgi:hypothetical protein